VLLADDYPGIVDALTRLLAQDCEVVESVADGRALLLAARRHQPDVIVLDLNLPHVHGLEACRLIRQRHPGIKVIMFTVESDPAIRQEALDAGATAFVSKLAVDDLMAAIKGLSGEPDVPLA
jgi:two-component system NarL family response regulator